MDENAKQDLDRRAFLGTAGAAGLMILKPQLVRGSQANSAVRVGLLGCGGRGTADATSIALNGPARIVALADLFEDRLLTAKDHFDTVANKQGHAGVAKSQMFKGPHAAEQILASHEIDAVVIATPPYFHPQHLAAAVQAGKHVYCEKPIATNLEEAVAVLKLAAAKGLKHGTVQDKLFLPGLKKLAFLRDSGFFGRMLSVRGEFGYWVFEGGWQEAQRPSWNYRSEDGGGIILDMVCHWRYVLDNLFGEVESVSCTGTTDIPERWDEKNKKYKATADDSAYATFKLKGGVIAHINMSWVTRVYRDDLVTFQVDGTHGSAVAGLTDCVIQARQATPRPVWNPDEKRTHDFYADWQKLPENNVYDNGFKEQWEMFIRHVCEDAPYKYTLLEGAKGVQLAECALQSWRERRWIDVAPIKV